MKTIIFYLITSITAIVLLILAIIWSITSNNYDNDIVEHFAVRENGSHTYIDVITVDGISHEYIRYLTSMCHFPECKYCKNKK